MTTPDIFLFVSHVNEDRSDTCCRTTLIPTCRCGGSQWRLRCDRLGLQTVFMHLATKLFLAAPCSGLPSELTAWLAQVSRLHFLTKLVLAAP
jgi:hypothetical protein